MEKERKEERKKERMLIVLVQSTKLLAKKVIQYGKKQEMTS